MMQMKSTIKVPEKVSISLSDTVLTTKGEKGEVSRDIFHPGLTIKTEGNNIELEINKESRHGKRVINTFVSHIKNMFRGVTEGYTAKLKIVYAHFPMSVKVEGANVIITNFLGERHPRKLKILEGAKVEIKGQDIIITGVDIEKVGQTAANFEKATKKRRKDSRIFLDGIYITKKPKEH